MFKKYRKWFADWTDMQGKRHRKSFATRNQARAFEEQQRRKKARGRSRASKS